VDIGFSSGNATKKMSRQPRKIERSGGQRPAFFDEKPQPFFDEK